MLSQRKLKILEAIITDYIATAEPIGSRTISKKYDLGISPATIRNEMSDLEELGLIMAPHASAGRIPSDLGYRLYVDSIMRQRELTTQEQEYLQKLISDNVNQIEYLMKETARAISLMTSYATIITEPMGKRTTIKHLQLVPVDERSVALVIVTSEHLVKNFILSVPKPLDFEKLNLISGVLNKHICGVLPEAINQEIVEAIELELAEHKAVCHLVLGHIRDTLWTDENVRFYTSGVRNLLTFPEFSDINRAKDLFHLLEERDVLITLLEDNPGEGIRVVIGSENPQAHFKNLSVIKAEYGSADFPKLGSIAIIGPTRMEYSQVTSVLMGIVKYIEYAINLLKGG